MMYKIDSLASEGATEAHGDDTAHPENKVSLL